MTDKELRKLSRADLLEMLLEQTKLVDKLKIELEETKAALSERRLDIENSGSIAEAALKVNRVFEAAQKASEQYLENIKRREEEATKASERQIQISAELENKSRLMAKELLESTAEKCQNMENETKRLCDRMLKETLKKASDTSTDINN